MSALFFFFFNDTATTEIYTLSLHDALPIFPSGSTRSLRRLSVTSGSRRVWRSPRARRWICASTDRKSTRLNSSHDQISYAVFCLKKKKTNRVKPRNANKKILNTTNDCPEHS